MEKTRPSFLTSVATVLGGQAACVALGVVTEICYARLLGPAGRGRISLCMMIIAVGVLIGGLGGDVPIVIWSADPKKKLSEWLPATLVWGLAGCAVSGTVWFLTYWRLNPAWLRDLSPSLATIVLATFTLVVLGAYLNAVLAGKERFRARAGVALVDQAAGLIGFAALLPLWGRKPEAAVAGNLIGLAVGLVLSAALLKESFAGRWKVQWPDRWIRSGFVMGLRGQLGNFAGLLSYRLDVFFVNFFLGPTEVGLYALGVAVSESLWQIPSAIASALFPRTARTLQSGANDFTCATMRQVTVISCALGLLLALASPIAIPLVFGERFRPSVAVVWWILPGTVALSLAKVASADLAGRHKNGYSSICASAALVVTVVLDWTLIPRMGIIGAALASSAAYLTDGALLLVALKHELKVSWSALLLPTRTDFETYRSAWLRFRSLSRLTPVSATGAREPS